MEQETGIGALYVEIFWGYGADFGQFTLGFPSNWTYK